MKIAIRVDASSAIGTGHVMRCLTLAQELRQMKAQVIFVCREHPGYLCGLIESHGFEVHRLGFENKSEQRISSQPQPAHLSWLGTEQDTDAEQSIEVLQTDAPWDWLIIDHYALDQRWETALRQVANKIMVIDDIADRKHDCDLLLDQNYFQEPGKRYEGWIPEHCETLLGPKYALLRPKFREARKFCRMRDGRVARILAYFGGNDPDNLTGLALGALSSPELSNLLVDAVIGPNNTHQEKLEKQVQERSGTRLHIQPEYFTELMLRADLCIGAGGTTTWERLCLGLPSSVITVADNQEPFTAELHKAGFVSWIGNKKDVSVEDIKNAMLSKIHNPQALNIFKDSPSLVDGMGAMRVAEKISPSQEKGLSLRKVTQEDLELFYYWANDPEVRENSFQQEPIAWQDHINWFQNKLISNDTQLFVLETNLGLPVGQIRFEFDQDFVTINYSLDSIVRGRGWGTKLVEKGIKEISKSFTDKILQAKVKTNNIVSKKIFLKLGFYEYKEEDMIVFRKKIS